MLSEVRTWGLSLEAMEEVEDRAGKAKLEREREVEERKVAHILALSERKGPKIFCRVLVSLRLNPMY